jgi:drug/metabolite transporter (DMT)-like permease
MTTDTSTSPNIIAPYSLWLTFVALETGAQVSLKFASASAGTANVIQSAEPIIKSPWFIGSILCDAANLVIWLTILRRHDLSVAVPLTSMTYFAVLLISWLLLHEEMSMPQLAGLMLVGIGLTLVAWEEASVE